MRKSTIMLILLVLFSSSLYLQAAKKTKYTGGPGMRVVVETSKPAAQVVENIKAVAPKFSFGVLNIHDLGQTLDEKGYPIFSACYVMDVCNPQYAQQVLSEDISMAVALPCRFAVYQEAGTTKIATIRPTAVLAGLNPSISLQAIAERVEEIMVNIMEEAK